MKSAMTPFGITPSGIAPVAIALCALVASSGAIAAAPKYTIVDLGTVTYNESEGRAINASGQVAGMVHDPAYNGSAFVTVNGAMVDLGAAGGHSAEAQAINVAGHVAGTRHDIGAVDTAVYYDGAWTQLFRVHSRALAVNDSNTVVGGFDSTIGPYKAFAWRDGNVNFVTDLGGTSSEAHGINASGWVVGWSQTAAEPYGSNHAFLSQAGVATDLGTLGGPSSQAEAINQGGAVTGCADAADGTQHAFRWVAGTMQDLGTLPGGAVACGLSINAHGRVVGRAANAQSLWTAVISAGRHLRVLSTLLPAQDRKRWVLQQATGINDKGQITGTGQLDGLYVHAFLMTPQ